MGATQSKKRRKERKRKKRGQIYDFDMPRSASADVIRTLGVSTSSCPLCQQLSEGRTFYNTLRGSDRHLTHSCLMGHYDSREDGYESCPSCSNSTYCLTGSVQRPDVERSTMSLNRNFAGHSSRLVQSKSSEFAELLDMLKDCERGDRISPRSAINPVQSAQAADNTSVNVAETMTATTTSTKTSSAPSQAANPEPHKTSISILEDEKSRLARWERQKLMAQQLRTLRKHIQQQEAAAAAAELTVLPFPEISLGKDFEKSSTNSLSSEPQKVLKENTNPSSPSQAYLSGSGSSTRRSLRSKFSKMSNYRYLDNHPALSKLQNEQNNRLECMEKRMKEIKISAMQEAERRKFAEIFPAKEDTKETEKMLQEARETLEKIKAEKKRKKEEQQKQLKVQSSHTNSETSFSYNHDEDTRTEDDSGEIIPVHIVPKQAGIFRHKGHYSGQLMAEQAKSQDKDAKPSVPIRKPHWLNDAWANISLGKPLTWLLLPFLMFSLILRMLLSLIITTPSSSSSNSSVSSHSSARRLSGNSRAMPWSSQNVDTRAKKQ